MKGRPFKALCITTCTVCHCTFIRHVLILTNFFISLLIFLSIFNQLRTSSSVFTQLYLQKFAQHRGVERVPQVYIRGTNNQLPNIFYEFVHLQLFNIKHKIVYLQVVWRQIFVFRKSCLSQTEENGCLWSYWRASLVSDFKLIRENNDLLSSRHK